MANDSAKPTIPAWQRAQQPFKPEREEQPGPQPSEDNSASNETPKTKQSSEEPVQAPTHASKAGDAGQNGSQTLEQVQAFLRDPAVKDESLEKKRTFLEGKGIPKPLIDQELGKPSPFFDTSDFSAFQSAPQPKAAPSPSSKPSSPPIITYPEFLSSAHKPAPLITPSRILNTAYLASGFAALIYGASTFLVNPMSAHLTEARHDFSTHSQTKIDEFNERLSALVSKIPEPKTSTPEEAEDDAESITSDPTELYHRDMGTQTSPPSSRRPSTPGTPGEPKSTLDKQTSRLAILHSHLSETLSGFEASEGPAKERQESVNDLRHYLDKLMYRTQAINIWGSGGADTRGGAEGKEDALEELKREIRGVKGVLLSARRFAPVSGVGRAGG